jgi:hypothetical protein
LILKAEDLPEDLRERFSMLMKKLSSRVEHFPHKPSIIRMRKPQSGKAAEDVLSIYIGVRGGT